MPHNGGVNMVKGRPPKAPELRIADGTHRKHRHGDIEAYGAEVLITKLPKAPDNKGQVFLDCWKHYAQRLIEVGQLSQRDLKPLEALCDAHQDESDAREALRQDGPYFATMQGISRHPAWNTIENLRKFIQAAQINYGFSPVGRSKVPPTVQGKKQSSLQSLNRKA